MKKMSDFSFLSGYVCVCVCVCLENGYDGRRNSQVSVIIAIINHIGLCSMLLPLVILTVLYHH